MGACWKAGAECNNWNGRGAAGAGILCNMGWETVWTGEEKIRGAEGTPYPASKGTDDTQARSDPIRT